jgi:hypothetical protein
MKLRFAFYEFGVTISVSFYISYNSYGRHAGRIKNKHGGEFELFTRIVMRISNLRVIMACSPSKVNRTFGGKCPLHFQG